MDTETSFSSLDERVRLSTISTLSPTAACGRPTTIALDDGLTLNIKSDLRIVAFLVSCSAEDGSLSDLAVAAATCRNDGTLIFRLDDLLAGLPLDVCSGGTVDPEAPWYRTLQRALQNVEVVVAHDAWAQRQIVESVHGGFAVLDWGCAHEQIDWRGLELPSERLAEIRTRVGELRRGRQVLDECHLLLEVLTQPSRPGHEPPLAQLFASVDAEAVRLFAGDVAAHRPALLERGYRWSPGQDGAPKGFFVDRARDVAQAERRFLARLLGRDEADLLERSLPASDRYRLP